MAAGRYRLSPGAALPPRSRRAPPRPAHVREVGAGGAMEERDGGFRKETVERLLRLHFRDGKTRVNGDALLLMAEMLKVFVRALPPGLYRRSGGASSAAGTGGGPGEGGHRARGEGAASAASRFLVTS
ncbi:centromere protein X isoform X2 [Numida meleagris]|uniref:centromere protein X isoform X2 n=1 Tax=Numida meleagris TaxID=8996 RepID=UPI000B3D8984|nr:centromere protein X isoform X2 [Numida meleagris]